MRYRGARLRLNKMGAPEVPQPSELNETTKSCDAIVAKHVEVIQNLMDEVEGTEAAHLKYFYEISFNAAKRFLDE